jgi:short-subunit dehydrogenase
MKNTALITGASGGIGHALARIFARNGSDLVITARSGDKLNELKTTLEQQYQCEVMVIPMDLAQEEAPEKLFALTEGVGIQVDYLVNNAGFGDSGYFHKTNWDKENTMLDLNMKTLTHMTKLFGSAMVARRKGNILNLASTAAFQPGPLMSIYYATKHYVLAFSEGIANEWKDFGVTVTALCPGPTESGFQQGADIEGIKLVKGRKLPTPADVAAYGYQAMQQGKTVAVHGPVNKLLAAIPRLMPRKMVANTVRKLHEPST